VRLIAAAQRSSCTVENPGGRYADRLEDAYVKQLLAESAVQ